MFGSFVPFAQPIAAAINVAGAVRSGPDLIREARRAFTTTQIATAEALTANAGRIVNPGQRQKARELVINEAYSWARVAAIVPFMVAVDDAQDLDPTTITLLSTLVRHSGRGLMVLTINTDLEPAGGDGPLASWLSEQARMSSVTELTLDPVPDAELTELAFDQFAGESVDETRLLKVIEASGGAPGRLMTLLAARPVHRAITH